MKFPKVKMPRISKRMGKRLGKTAQMVVTVAQIALREIERNARKIK